MAEKHTKTSVLKAWSDLSGKKDQYDLREVENFEGETQTQLVDKDTGSIAVAANGTGQVALDKLGKNVGSFIDGAIAPKESTSDENAVQRTSRGAVATPTQPAALNDPKEPVTAENGDVPTNVNPVTNGSELGE